MKRTRKDTSSSPTRKAARKRGPVGTVSEIVGSRLQDFRARYGLTQQDLARAAESCGLEWSRSTIGDIETGRKRLDVEELMLLPLALATFHPNPFAVKDRATLPFTMRDLVPPNSEVKTSMGHTLAGVDALALMGGGAELTHPVVRGAGASIQPRYDESEYKAARSLGCDLDLVRNIAVHLWGHPLAQERDARLGERDDLKTTNARRVALGNITRQLLAELRDEVFMEED